MAAWAVERIVLIPVGSMIGHHPHSNDRPLVYYPTGWLFSNSHQSLNQPSTQPNSSSETKSPLSEVLSAISSRLRFILAGSGAVDSWRPRASDETLLASRTPCYNCQWIFTSSKLWNRYLVDGESYHLSESVQSVAGNFGDSGESKIRVA